MGAEPASGNSRNYIEQSEVCKLHTYIQIYIYTDIYYNGTLRLIVSINVRRFFVHVEFF